MEILVQGLKPTVAGLAAGTLAAVLLTRTLKSFLYGVSPNDGGVLAGSAVLLVIVATAAILGPVLQATRVNPANVLRGD
jgi:putative ABC transport system permease protein